MPTRLSGEAGLPSGAGRAAALIHAELSAMREAHHEGADPDGIATVEVDGSGLVTGVRLARTVSRHSPAEVAGAVRAAYEEAERARLEAVREAAERVRRMRREPR